MSYRCNSCDQIHEGLPTFGSDYPFTWFNIPTAERSQRASLTEDACIIDDEHFFIRGVLEIPIQASTEVFTFGVWVSQKRENFELYINNFESNQIGPFFGWLNTDIAYYAEETLNLKTMAHFRGNGLRPWIELEPTDHPLAVAQRSGISLDKAWEIAHFYLDQPHD